MQHENDNIIRDYDIVLDEEFGAPGTPERSLAELEAYHQLCIESAVDEIRSNFQRIQEVISAIDEVLLETPNDSDPSTKSLLETLGKVKEIIAINERISLSQEKITQAMNLLHDTLSKMDATKEGNVIRRIKEHSKEEEEYITIDKL